MEFDESFGHKSSESDGPQMIEIAFSKAVWLLLLLLPFIVGIIVIVSVAHDHSPLKLCQVVR